MKADSTNSRTYWSEVLLAGGFSAIPRWTHEASPGVNEYDLDVGDALTASVARLAEQLDVGFDSILLASHAKVLAVLTGEPRVTTGYALAENDDPLPLRLSASPPTWREIIVATNDAVRELERHAPYAVAEHAEELGLGGPLFETVFVRTGLAMANRLGADSVLQVGLCSSESTALCVCYRTDSINAAFAHRIADYHRAALDLIVADPDGRHWEQTLVPDDELQFQLDTFTGPERAIPDCGGFHAVFEQQVAIHPDAVAAVHGTQEWTYHELNARSNQLARALLARGVETETVVGVVTERNLDWMASVLAIFKAGGAYLPIEPHFPADRIATTLSRAECTLVLTEAASVANLDQALESLPDAERFFVADAYGEGHPERNLGIDVADDQLAYLYFTSGSTGEPKGAMCEHGGMLNHLYAKIDDLEIEHGQVVAQIAPQCFDISLWQLVSALLAGGRTLLVEQETILDPAHFVDTIVTQQVSVMQVVPSYLEVLLNYFDQHPRALPDLHCVSVTGEAISMELAERFFASFDGIKLVNAYGLTETSDDTNHEVMSRPPSGTRVPLGRVVNNVEVRVVDENLLPVPLGAPGEIVFSGICVGRGYINDPERTAQAFLDDNLRPGQRLYRSGDFGRWRPDHKLEFLGRRDAQVKVRGFRIEIGEIENTMLRIPGVRQGVVVVSEHDGRGKQLVGFYSGTELDVDDMRHQLGASLPHYMVPSVLHWQESLPLTDNGKFDRKTLRGLAETLEVGGQEFQAPQTPSEERLAAAWSRILDVPQDEIGRLDNFFDLGGSSLSAVELVIDLDKEVSLKDVTRHPGLAEQAALLDGGAGDTTGLLQLLSEPDEKPSGTLVCFPYAGGNAVNFQAMASELRGSGLAVHAVELPGHELGVEPTPFRPLDDVVDAVVAEITNLGLPGLMLWGHSSGAALALATARRLEADGIAVHHVFIGAQLLGDVERREAHLAQLEQQSDTEIAERLGADSGYSELGEMDEAHVDHVGAAYRHDCVAAHHYLIEVMQSPPPVKIGSPVTVMLTADDPAVSGDAHRFHEWELMADTVSLLELPTGGHYFLRTRPAEAADCVLRHTLSMA